MAVTVELKPDDALTEEERAEYARLRSGIDYGERYGFGQWAPKTWRVLVRVDGALAGHVGVVNRVVSVGGRRLRVGGISGVWTVREHRGRGIGRAGMEAAVAFIRDELEAEAALLLCWEHVVPFYERLGWQRVQGTATFSQTAGCATWPAAVMVLPLRRAAWPAGAIDLRGLPW